MREIAVLVVVFAPLDAVTQGDRYHRSGDDRVRPWRVPRDEVAMNPFVFTFSGAAILAVAGLILHVLNLRDERRQRSKSK